MHDSCFCVESDVFVVRPPWLCWHFSCGTIYLLQTWASVIGTYFILLKIIHLAQVITNPVSTPLKHLVHWISQPLYKNDNIFTKVSIQYKFIVDGGLTFFAYRWNLFAK